MRIGFQKGYLCVAGGIRFLVDFTKILAKIDTPPPAAHEGLFLEIYSYMIKSFLKFFFETPAKFLIFEKQADL